MFAKLISRGCAILQIITCDRPTSIYNRRKLHSCFFGKWIGSDKLLRIKPIKNWCTCESKLNIIFLSFLFSATLNFSTPGGSTCIKIMNRPPQIFPAYYLSHFSRSPHSRPIKHSQRPDGHSSPSHSSEVQIYASTTKLNTSTVNQKINVRFYACSRNPIVL